MTKFLLIAALGLCLITGIARADEAATDQLLARLESIGRLQGEFRQRQYGAGDLLLGESSGSFRLLRPGYFSWEIRSPDRQLIIADPQYLWHHDLDLETVTRRPVTGAQGMSPLQVLGGDESVLRERFEVTQEGGERYTLVPVSGNPGFKRLTLLLQGPSISGMEILDNLNQRVVIEFQRVDSGGELTPADFSFTPPDGADLFYYDQ